MMVGLEIERIRQALAVLETQPRGVEQTENGFRLQHAKCSEKVVRIIVSYTDYVDRVVWKSLSMKNKLLKKIYKSRILKRIYLERLGEPFIYNLFSLFVIVR